MNEEPTSQRTGLLHRCGQSPNFPAIAGLIVAVLSWPYASVDAGPGLDPSWHIATHLAVGEGLSFGPDFMFTYGPLGFLAVPKLITAWTGAIAVVFSFVLRWALASTLIWATTWRLGPWVALAASLAVSMLLGAHARLLETVVPEIILALIFVWVVAIYETRGGKIPLSLLIGVGALAGASLLIKFSVGAASLGVLLLVPFLVKNRIEALVLLLASYAAAAIGVWVATGNSLSDLGDWIKGSISLSSEFAGGLGVEDTGRAWEYWVFGSLAIGILALVWLHTRSRPALARMALLGMTAWLAFFAFKQGFVRHDALHSLTAFSLLLLALAAFRWRDRLTLWGADITAIGLVGAIVWTSLQGGLMPLRDLIDPLPRTEAFAGQARDLAGSPQAIVHRGQSTSRDILQIDPRLIAAIGAEQTHISPYEASIAWAYGLRWKPIPTIQDYAAYTGELDDRNAEALSSPDGPAYVLRHVTDRIDGHFTTLESPAGTLALVCHFSQTAGVDRWVLLKRVAPRCGRARLIGTTQASWGERVSVPSDWGPEDLIYVRIDAQSSAFDRLRGLIHKLPVPSFRLNDDTRILPRSLLGQPLVIQIPASAGHGEFPGLATANSVTSYAADELSMRFYAVRVQPAA